MARYDGLIIPRSYNEYISKSDAATLSQALKLGGVMDATPTAGSNNPVQSGGVDNALKALAALPTDAVIHYSFDELPNSPETAEIIIDNANGQFNAVNNGGIATKGVSGKGLLGLGKNNIITNTTFPNPTDKSAITLSIWVKYTDSYNDIGPRNLFGTGAYDGAFVIEQHATNDSMEVGAFVRQNSSNSRQMFVKVSRNEWHNAVMIWENKNLSFYVDGNKYTAPTLNISDFTFGNYWRIGDTSVVQGQPPAESGDIEYYVDDVQIFDRALSESEVMALYLNRGNTPKYYTWADWKLSQTENATRNAPETKNLQSEEKTQKNRDEINELQIQIKEDF